MDSAGRIDFDQVRDIARREKPKLIWAGATAYPRIIDFETFGQIADEVGAVFAADIAHIAGLVAGGAHPSPVPHAHIVTTTTHKTLRGPRGGMIMVTQKGLDLDKELGKKIDRAVFPGLQGGPHNHTTAAIAFALHKARQPEFAAYARQVVENARVLAEALMVHGFTLVSGGTENHLLLLDLTPDGAGRGKYFAKAADQAGLTFNYNSIPRDPANPFNPSGVRMGTPAATARGMREPEMRRIADWLAAVYGTVKPHQFVPDAKARGAAMRSFAVEIASSGDLAVIRQEVADLSLRFPVPGVLVQDAA